ncbi:MAG: radical SAM protein [Desulfitobacteriaceae bacterium]|nr:radical SAM protein [Desulfitobacteriaceae bacterium]MDI6878188.1 radical SAM protein [Desulfitobacteriaceae bacterium]MDI6913499.1 radical SAM protein [Desulfitobacteriaceae bacterium]
MDCQCQEPQTGTQADHYLNQGHPCFSTERHGMTGRIHLAVAPECNISCNYCVRKFDCANESRPGVTSKVITPEEAVQRVFRAKQSALGPKLNVVGIAGPGEPLANAATFRALALIHEHFPTLTLCLSTNGLFLPDKLNELLALGVSHVTVTMNTLSLDTASAVYSFVKWQGQILIGRQAVSLLLERQLIGIELAAQAGLIVKVNTVVIPGVNDQELEAIAHTVKGKGAHLHNLMPLIPQGKFAQRPSPSPGKMREYRKLLSPILPQMSHCQQCRADAIGLV